MPARIVVLLIIPAFIVLAIEKGSNTMMLSNSQTDRNNDMLTTADMHDPEGTETATFALG